MDEIADATEFLLRNAGVNAHDLVVEDVRIVVELRRRSPGLTVRR
jgi:hypothetical protein